PPSRAPTTARLFPCTTLFRAHQQLRCDGLAGGGPRIDHHPDQRAAGIDLAADDMGADRTLLQVGLDARAQRLERLGVEKYGVTRSEEHTSELQSRENLVCRLL